MNNFSMGTSTAFDISIANFNDGLYLAASSLIIVSRLTPTICASSSCVKSFKRRYFFKLQIKFKSKTPISFLKYKI